MTEETKTLEPAQEQAGSDSKRIVMPPSSVGREQQAIRWALDRFEVWHNQSNVPPAHTGYYYEVLSLIEEAAQIGFGAAHGQDIETITKHIESP